MDRPRPIPGSPAVRALEARTNRLNSWSASAGGMPMPESATSIRQVRPSQLRGDPDHAVPVRELDRVGQQVVEDLRHPPRVAPHGRPVPGPHHDRDALLGGARPKRS